MSTGKVALISGGIDSIVAALLAGVEGAIPVHVDYGQLSRSRERECAQALSERYFQEELVGIDLTWYGRFVSPPLCSDERALKRFDRRAAYAPFRNSLLIMVAAAVAEANGMRTVVTGSHNGDTVYPDNSPAYLEAMNGLLAVAGKAGAAVEVTAPVMRMDKAEIVRRGYEMGVPFQHTWSCYGSGEVPCRRCLNCSDRSKAFELAGLADPAAQPGG